MSRQRGGGSSSDIGDVYGITTPLPEDVTHRARIATTDWAIRWEVPTDQVRDVLDMLGLISHPDPWPGDP